MAFVFHRDLRIPLWTVAFCAVIVTGTPAPPPPLTITVGIAIIALSAMAMVQRRRVPVLLDVRPIVSRDRPEGRARPVLQASLVPGEREVGVLTAFATSITPTRASDEVSSMDATTTAERQREGGGAPSQRRAARTPRNRRGTVDAFVAGVSDLRWYVRSILGLAYRTKS